MGELRSCEIYRYGSIDVRGPVIRALIQVAGEESEIDGVIERGTSFPNHTRTFVVAGCFAGILVGQLTY